VVVGKVGAASVNQRVAKDRCEARNWRRSRAIRQRPPLQECYRLSRVVKLALTNRLSIPLMNPVSKSLGCKLFTVMASCFQRPGASVSKFHRHMLR
jgi:hypothetical protein